MFVCCINDGLLYGILGLGCMHIESAKSLLSHPEAVPAPAAATHRRRCQRMKQRGSQPLGIIEQPSQISSQTCPG